MDITSDVRYSVLKEKQSVSDLNWNNKETTLDDEISLNNVPISADSKLNKTQQQQQQQQLKANINEFELSNTKKTNCLIKFELESKDTQVLNNKMETNDHLNLNAESNINKNERNISSVNTNNNIIINNSFNSNNSESDQQHIINIPSLEFSALRKFKNKRTFLEKFLFFIINILIIIILIQFLTMYRSYLNKNNNNTVNKKNNTSFCSTPMCILTSGSIYKALNTKVDPCEDFYEYSCGGWMRKNLIPIGFPRWGTLSLITYQNQLLIKEQLESEVVYPDITEAEMKAKIFYRSCMDNKEIIEKLGAKPLKDILDKYVNKDSNDRLVINETFSNLLSIIQIEFGLNSLFEFNVLDDDKNPNYTNIEIIQGSLGLDRSFYINNSSEKNAKALEIYKKTIVNVLTMLFGKMENVTEEMENLIEFETNIAKIMFPTERLQNVENMYTRVKLSNLNEKHATFLDWTKFINKFLSTYNSTEVVKPSDEIIVMGLEYFESLTSLIDEYQKDKRKEKTLKLSVIFHLIKFSLPFLSKDYRAQFSAIGEALTGSVNIERWQTCIEHTDNIFGLGYAITRMFIRKSPNNAKTEAQKMIKSIKKAFIDNFPKIPWMDNETRVLAEEKVNSVDELIGYPDFIDDDEQLNLRYSDLFLSEEDYFGNEIKLVQYALRSEIVTYRTRVNRAEWEMTSSAVNAYYSPTRNQIVFPSGILQEPFFHPENAMSINYGSIGSIMGHELTHGFDDSGREYDKYGMMHQWWNNKTIEDFKKASECIIEQYSKYKVEDEYLNGKQTLGENIADNGGLRSAYEAYEKWVEEHGEENLLPLLNLTHRQLFFVSFAQTWCSKSTPDSLHLSLSIDQHSPPRYRVIGTISNSVEFANAFKCPKNSKMNPISKCNLW